MALDNVQTVDRVQTVKKEGQVKPDYSIKLKKETVRKAEALMAERDLKMAQLKESISDDVKSGATVEQLVGKNIVLAADIEKLDKKINILLCMQGPVEQKGERAIRLIAKMMKEAKKKSDAIYAVNEKKEVETVPETTPIVEVPQAPTVNVQQIAANEGPVIGQNIDAAISGAQSLDENAIKEVMDNALGIAPTQVAQTVVEPITEVQVQNQQPLPASGTPVEVTQVAPIVEPVSVVPEPVTEVQVQNQQPLPVSGAPVEVTQVAPIVEPVPAVPDTTTEVSVDLEEQNRINNKTMENFVGDNAIVNNNEYIPMTDDEVAESQRKLAEVEEQSEKARYQRIIEDAEYAAKKVEALNASKGFNFATVPEMVTEPENATESEKPLRDEIQIPADREIEVEVKVDEKTEEVDQPKLVERDDKEKEEPRWESMKLEEKENLVSHRDESIEELAALIKEEQEKQEEKQKEKIKSAEELKNLKEDYDKLIENEKAAEERLEELKKQKERKDKELEENKEELRKRLETIRDNNSSIDADIQKNREEFDSIKQDGDKRNDRLEHLNSEADGVEKNISEIDEMLEKFGSVGEDAAEFKKTM